MTLFKLTLQELRQRRMNFFLGVLSVLIATAILGGSLMILNAYDLRTDKILGAKQAELEIKTQQLQQDTIHAMEGLGFNITILPQEQNLGDWYAEDYAERTMPQESLAKLKSSQLITIDHLEPILSQKVRWPETKWTILISGIASADAPAAGQADLGDEIARGLNLKPGDTLQLMGQPLIVRNRKIQEGAIEDITLTLSLSDAQTLLGKKGQISEIRARQRRVAWQDIARIREEVSRILPDTQIVEKGSEILAKVTAIRQVELKGAEQIENEQTARSQMRRSVQRTLGILLPFILLACVAWIYLLAADNAARRTVEIGTLRSLGFSSGSVAKIFVFRSLLTGLIGGVAGLFVCAIFAHGMPIKLFIFLLPLALIIALAGSIIPVRRAVNRDPADILRGET